MRARSFLVPLVPGSKQPLFQQIAQAIADDIARGRLEKGRVLPGTRTLADLLGVHRTTVLAAYSELESQGWVSGSRGRGTIVTAAPTERAFARRRRALARSPDRIGFDLEVEALSEREMPRLPRGTLSFWGGVPDPRLFPLDALARAYRRAGRANGGALLSYSGDPRGEPSLRAALARLLTETRNVVVTADDVLVTRGSQMALHLIAKALIRPGDRVAVEELGYPAAHRALRAAGAELVPIAIDAHGLDVRELARRVADRPIRAVYLTPHHHYPTTVTLGPDRRLELIELARDRRFAIIEDDYDQEFHFTGRPVLPLASIDPHGVVVYVGTLAKVLAPGLRLGYVTGPRRLLSRLANARALVDRQGDWLVERAVAELFEDGDLQRHVRRMRRTYQSRRDVLIRALERRLGSAVSFRVPSGGMALWVAVDPEIDVDRWQERALSARVMFQTARAFTLDGSSRPYARFGYSLLNEAEIHTAVERLARALGQSA